MRDTIRARLARRRATPFTLGNFSQLPGLGTPSSGVQFDEVGLGPSFCITEEQIRHHMAVLGSSGTGKSKFLELFGRHLINTLNGFTFIDPHGDTVEALLSYATRLALKKGPEYIIGRLHYLEPTNDHLFAYDPFRFPGEDLPPNRRDVAFHNWLHATADRLTDAFLRGFADVEKQIMVRMDRWLRNLLKAVGTDVGGGRHLSLADVFILLNRDHDHHPDVVKRLQGHLPPAVEADLDFLYSIKRAEDRDRYTESTINHLSRFFSPHMESIFAGTAPSIDISEIIQQRHILLVNLKETDYLSEKQGIAIAGLLLNEILRTVARTPKRQRVRHYLIVDEAGTYIAEDFKKILERARKWKLSFCVGGQSPSTFRRGDLDLIEDLMDHCRTFISFQQGSTRSVKLLGRFFAYPNRNLSELMQVVDRPDGHQLRTLTDVNASLSTTLGTQAGTAQSNSAGVATTTSQFQSASIAEGVQHTDTQSSGASEQQSTFSGVNSGNSSGGTPMIIDGQIHWIPTATESKSVSSGGGIGSGIFDSQGSADSHSLQQGKSIGAGQARSESSARGKADVQSLSKSLSMQAGVTLKQTLVPKTREEWHPTGQPRLSLEFQDAIHEDILTNAPDRFCLVRIRTQKAGTRTLVLYTADVDKSFANEDEEEAAVTAFVNELLVNKPYIFTPELPHRTQSERIERFLGMEQPAEESELPQAPVDEDKSIERHFAP